VRDPELKLPDIAAASGISVRYANALLAQENTSLERFIMFRRLQHCRQAIEDPSQLGRTVGDIAYSCGFADLSTSAAVTGRNLAARRASRAPRGGEDQAGWRSLFARPFLDQPHEGLDLRAIVSNGGQSPR
jgi:AraC-like DNA-binding protein